MKVERVPVLCRGYPPSRGDRYPRRGCLRLQEQGFRLPISIILPAKASAGVLEPRNMRGAVFMLTGDGANVRVGHPSHVDRARLTARRCPSCRRANRLEFDRVEGLAVETWLEGP